MSRDIRAGSLEPASAVQMQLPQESLGALDERGLALSFDPVCLGRASSRRSEKSVFPPLGLEAHLLMDLSR